MKKVITYGTFDLLHYGHINLLRRAKAMGDLCGFCDYAEGWIRHNPNGFCPDNFDPLGVIARPAAK